MKIKCTDTTKAEQKIKKLHPLKGAVQTDRIYIEQREGKCFVTLTDGAKMSRTWEISYGDNCIILKKESLLMRIIDCIFIAIIGIMVLFSAYCIIWTLFSRKLELYEIRVAAAALFMLLVMLWTAYLGPEYRVRKYIKKAISEDKK